MKVYLAAIFFLLILGCSRQDAVVGPVPTGIYNYTSYDTAGKPIVQGWFTLSRRDSTRIEGEWHFTKVGNPPNIGPQTGDGHHRGGIQGNRLWLDLQPDFRDNNLLLSGTFDGNRLSGQWQWVTFIGVTSGGRFQAVERLR